MNTPLFQRKHILRKMTQLIYAPTVRINVIGAENIPDKPVLIAYNHLSYFDTSIMLSIFPEPLQFVAASSLWGKRVSIFLKLYQPIPVYRERPVNRRMLDRVCDTLKSGISVAIAPEGGISRQRALRQARHGVSYLAIKTGTPILPVAIWGTEKISNRVNSLSRGEAYIKICQTISPPRAMKGPNLKQQRLILTQHLMCKLANNLPLMYRGVYLSCAD